MSMYAELLSESNNRKVEAIQRSGHCIVLAGPGTGKTRTLTLKAAKLLYEDVFPPRGLACVTYTLNMAHELMRQLRELGIKPHGNVFIGTIHSFCLTNVLLPFASLFDYPLPNPIRVMSETDQAALYRNLWERGGYVGSIREYQPERNWDGEWSPRLPIVFQKYRRTVLDGVRSLGSNPNVENLVTEYEDELLRRGFVDFDLQVKWSMQLVEQQQYVKRSLQARFPWLLVDEYQDVGLPLHRMVKALTSEAKANLFAIGDINQCIYEFSGANPDYLLELSSTPDIYGEPIVLERNYRFLRRIAEAAEIVAPSAVDLEVDRVEGPGSVQIQQSLNIFRPELFEELAQSFPYEEIMILHRTWNGCREVTDLLRRQQIEIPYFIGDKAIFDPRRPLLDWVGNLMTFTLENGIGRTVLFQDLCQFWGMLLQLNGVCRHEAFSLQPRMQLYSVVYGLQQHKESVWQWLQKLNQGLGLAEKLIQYGLKSPDEMVEFRKFEAAVSPGGELSDNSLEEMQNLIQQKDRVYIGTLHSSKGRETKVVMIAGAESLNTRVLSRQSEYRRLLYVGITRAKDKLYIGYNRGSYLADELTRGMRRRNSRK